MAKLISESMLKDGEKPPKIEFPCDYPIKILGDVTEDFIDTVVSVVQQYAPDMDSKNISVKESSKGKFQSVTVVIKATGKEQIENIFAKLKKIEAVKIVL